MNTIPSRYQRLHTRLSRRRTSRGGIGEENRGLGFPLPIAIAQLVTSADGRRAPIHLLGGLPKRLVLRRDASGKVIVLKGSVNAGFVREGRFYTREQAAMAMMREARDGNSPPSPRPVQASPSPSRAGVLL
ncbi:MAG: dihydroorotase [Gammaproteobacteria bacterium]